jgi:hypothetical protein
MMKHQIKTSSKISGRVGKHSPWTSQKRNEGPNLTFDSNEKHHIKEALEARKNQNFLIKNLYDTFSGAPISGEPTQRGEIKGTIPLISNADKSASQ